MIIPDFLNPDGGPVQGPNSTPNLTHTPSERDKKEGRRQSGEWKDTANEDLNDSQIACLPKAIT